ncbi:hypothetical protein V8G54_023598, partial [Vigna mungo]
YLDLVKVFYANVKVVNEIITSRVKRVDIKLDDEIWTSIVGFRLGGEKSYKDFPRLNKLRIFQTCLRYPNEPKDYTLFKVGGMKRDDRLLTFVLMWILILGGRSHSH